MKPRDITGMVFGRLTAIRQVGITKQHKAIWLFSCACGNEHRAVSGNVASGITSSCGCIRTETITKHGMSGTRIDHIFRHMVDRCYNAKNEFYYCYGGKGVTVCDEWLADKASFFKWSMSHGYSNKLSIDRKDNNGNYSPDNCRWATIIEQSNNTSRCIFVAINDKVKTVAEWAREFSVPVNTLRYRIKHGRNLLGRKQQGEIRYAIV